MKILRWISTHRKAMISYAGALVTLVFVVASTAHWNAAIVWLTALTPFLTAIGVHAAPNAKSLPASPTPGQQ